MLRINFSKVNLIIVPIILLAFCGFSDIAVEDIETAIMKKEYAQAKTLAEQLLAAEAQTVQKNRISYYLGLCDLRLEDYTQAREIFTALTKQELDGTLRDQAYLGLFDAYYLDDQYEQARHIAERLIKISPRSELLSLIYLKFARVNLKLASWQKARTYLQKIVGEFPNSLEAHTAKQLLNEKQYFAVQVGAFIERQRAESLLGELQQKGEYAYIVETVDKQSRTFYRVRVGQLTLLDQAQDLKSKLSQAGYPTEIYP